MQQEDKIKQIQAAENMAFEALDIIDQIKIDKDSDLDPGYKQNLKFAEVAN